MDSDDNMSESLSELIKPECNHNKAVTTDKRRVLRDIKQKCIKYVKSNTKKYLKLKFINDMLDLSLAFLQSAGISCTVLGMTYPVLLPISAVVSGVAFIGSRLQDKYNFKTKLAQHQLTIRQFNHISREIVAVLSKNNLSEDEYYNYIIEIQDKISLIEDSSIIV